MAEDQPMWGNNRAVAPTPGAAIVAVDLGDNFIVKGYHLSMIKDRHFDGRLRADPHKRIAKFVEMCGMFCYGNTNADAIKLKLFPSSLTGEDKIWFNELSPGVITTWEEMRQAFDLLHSCHGHGLGHGTIIQIFYHGLDKPTQAILDVGGIFLYKTPNGGIFLYKTPNEAHHLLEDRVLLKLDLSKENKTKPLRKTVTFTENMKEMRDGCKKCGGPHSSSDCDDKPMGGPKEEEANYASRGYRGNYYGRNSSNWRDRKSYHRDENRNSNPGEENPPIPRLPEKKPDKSEFEKTMREFIIAQKTSNDFVKNQFYNLKTKVEQGQKNNQAVIQDLETKFGRISNHQSSRTMGMLPSNTQTNPKPSTSNERPYRPPPARNEHVNVVFTRSGKTYDPPANPNTKTVIFLDNSKDEAEEVKKEVEPLPKKPTQIDTPPLKAYKPKIPYPQRLNKEKMEARYAKFLDMIKEVRINVPLINVLAGMPNYGKFLKDRVSNKSKMEQISAAFLTEECSAILQNKIPPKLGDLGNFVILQMEEDDRVPLVLGRPFLHTVDAIIRVKNKELNLRIGEDRAIFHIDKAMQHSHVNDDTCFRMGVIDEITEDELDALLNYSKPFLNTSEKIRKTPLDKEFNEFM
ncbi:hypothetical protein Tco_1078518 [Tanacetum coccineum]|uniref:Reverse transcriptase domain-containing protein n=1 Tax=Tanacetum coccineum TaxID=301880 RepID=A0ABQ5HP78_9ASTR